MAGSETTQSLGSNGEDVSEQEYLSIVTGKTAFLMSCSCRVGAILGDTLNGEVEALADYGMNLGMAFQITDDLLDLTGEKNRLGKPPGSDVREGRMTLPFIHAMNVAGSMGAQQIRKVFGAKQVDQDVLAQVREWVAQNGGIEYSRDKAREYADVCKERLKALDESESRISLAMLADYVVGRAY